MLAIVRQRGRSKLGGIPAEMLMAQLWTFRDGKLARMDMYSDPSEAFKAIGLEK